MERDLRHEIDAYFEPDLSWLGEINRQVLRLEREAGVFPPRRTHLHCALWRGAEGRAGVTLTLRVGDTEMRSRGEDPSPVAATRRAFEELRRQLAAHTAESREEGFWSRTSLNRGPQGDGRRAEPESKREAAEVIEHHLSGLYDFVRREITGREATGILPAGDLTPEEVVDEVAVASLEGFAERPREMDFSRWLYQLALDALERRAEQIKAERGSVQRLEDMRPEDLLADEHRPAPEEAAARPEFRRHIDRTLAGLPRRWRQAFVLYSVEGLTLEEVARVTRLPVDSAHRLIEMAREYLRERLIEAGAARAAGEPLREEVNA